MHSNKLFIAMALLVVLSTSSAALGQAGDPAQSHCLAEERVQFSCHINTKIVSLCAAGGPGTITALSYRYGLPGKIENEFVARADNANRFFAMVSPASPRAQVTQVWFDRGDVRYLLTECIGGNCPQEGGLAVLRGDKVLMNARCKEFIEGDQPRFARGLITYGPEDGPMDVDKMRSTTELLKIEEEDNNLYTLFPNKHGPQ